MFWGELGGSGDGCSLGWLGVWGGEWLVVVGVLLKWFWRGFWFLVKFM